MTYSRLDKCKTLITKIRYRVVCLLGRNHSKWLRKHNLFGLMGTPVLYQTHHLPNNPKLIKIHNNVWIAANVVFFEHDVINAMFNRYDESLSLRGHHSCIEIHDNVFIGGGAILAGNVSVGPNAIIAAGSVVVKDVPPGSVVGGNPAKVIGTFDKLLEKRIKADLCNEEASVNDFIEDAWKIFYDEKNGSEGQ